MKKKLSILFLLPVLLALSFAGNAEIQDQGLNSILLIIDKAIEDMSRVSDNSSDEDSIDITNERENAAATVVNLSKTLGNLSYSRLQCGEAAVLSEFTQRVQRVPEESRDAMRDAFQQGFDKSKLETKLLSEDECKRLTQSRIRAEKIEESNVDEPEDKQSTQAEKQAEVEEVIDKSPKLRYLRIAEISGQLAFKTKFCHSKKVFNRDYNEFIESVPEDYLEEVKEAYWKGYKHGKRINKNLTEDQC